MSATPTPSGDDFLPLNNRRSRQRSLELLYQFYEDPANAYLIDDDEYARASRMLVGLPKRAKKTQWSSSLKSVRKHLKNNDHPIWGKGHMTVSYAKQQGLVPEDTKGDKFEKHIMKPLIQSEWGKSVGLHRHAMFGHRWDERGPRPILWVTADFVMKRYATNNRGIFNLHDARDSTRAAKWFVAHLKSLPNFDNSPIGKKHDFINIMENTKVFDMKQVGTRSTGPRWLMTKVGPLLDNRWRFLRRQGWRWKE